MTIRQRVRRIGAALLAAVLLTCLPVAPAQAASVGDFRDVSGSDWYYSAVDFVVGRGLYNGTSSTTFSPNAKMSRGMFVTVLGRYANVDAPSWLIGNITGSDVNLRSGAGSDYEVLATLQKGTTVTIHSKAKGWYNVTVGSVTGYVSADYMKPANGGLSDVGYGAYYAGYAAWAKAKGIVTGYSSGKFLPDESITREQMCAIMNRFAAAMGITLTQTGGVTTFPDSGRISSWAKADVEAMLRCGVIKGNASGNLNPTGSATRAEAATMIQRFNSACGGFSPSVQRPDIPDQPDPGGSTGSQGAPTPPSGGGETAPPGETADPNTLPDTPADYAGSVGIQSSVIRVGVLAKTKNTDTSVDSVTLQNTNGTGFEFGVMDGRQFSSSGFWESTTITVTTDGAAFTVIDPNRSEEEGENILYTSDTDFAVRPASGGKAVTRVNGQYKYYGDFELRQASGKPGYITVINYVDIEDYVKGVVPYEFSSSWPDEAMKAAAIACRSYAMSYDWGIYSPYGMDLITGSGTQLYRGRGISYGDGDLAGSDAAVEATRGQYLSYNGSICRTFFSACDGGQTLSASQVFGTNYPYLQGKADPYEQAAKGDLAAAGIGYDSMVKASHRVGMSAWGAYAMARYYNKSCASILGFYYTGTSISTGG